MAMTNWDGFIFQFDKSYEDQMEEFDFIKVRQISENNIEPIREIQEHTQMCHEITYIISGKGTFYSGATESLLQQGDIHVISKGVRHRIVPAERSNLSFANIGFEFSDKMQEGLEPIRQLFEKREHMILRDNGDIRILMTMLINELQSRGAYSHTLLECYIKLILTHVYRMAQTDEQRVFSPKKSTSPMKLTPYAIIRYVDNNLFEFPGVDDIARALGYSQSYISHMFKEKMGITLQEYICNKKIEASLDFLKHQKYTVTQVAMMLNYASVQSFCKAFRKAMGCSPTEYQKRHLREKGSEGGERDNEES